MTEPVTREPTLAELIAAMAQQMRTMLWLVGALLLIVLLQSGATLLQSRALNHQEESLDRQAENTKYNVALAEQAVCVRGVQSDWLHGIGLLILTPSSSPDYGPVRESFRVLDRELGRLDELCPEPKPPGFIHEALGG